MEDQSSSRQDAEYFEQIKDYAKAADIYQELGEFEKAKKLYQMLEQTFPFHKDIKFKFGKLLTVMQEWDAAIIKLQEVGNIGAFVEETCYLLAECFTHKGYIYAAKEMYAELLERNYNYKDAREKLQQLEAPGQAFLPATRFLPACSPLTRSGDAEGTLYQTMQGIAREDRYVLIEELGRGGMGIVYKAEDTTSNRLVAIKVLPPYLAGEEVNRLRFFREADIITKLHHPNIVNIFEMNQRGNFIVMEYLQGGTLSTWKAQYHPQERDILSVMRQVLDALHAVHQYKIVHRDIKPDNILMADQNTAKLTDFGIAHICGATITHTGTHIGTIPYMSPEQILGEQIDQRSDIYAIGVLLYELFTGGLPFTGKDTSYHHIHTPPTPPREACPFLSFPLNGIILKCLEKRPEERYQDVKALQAALLAV